MEHRFDADTTAALSREAMTADRRPSRVDGVNTEQARGGTPRRHLTSVNGGPFQQGLYLHRDLIRLLSKCVGAPVRPCGECATYSIYESGDFLDVHRDIPSCDIALISCVFDNNPSDDGGAIDVWFDDALTPLDVLRRGEGKPPARVAPRGGHTMLPHGGIMPHRVRRMAPGRLRVVSLMCFEMLTGLDGPVGAKG
jgi:hypothetical protein